MLSLVLAFAVLMELGLIKIDYSVFFKHQSVPLLLAPSRHPANRYCTKVELGLKQAPALKLNCGGISIFSLCPTASQMRVSDQGVFIM